MPNDHTPAKRPTGICPNCGSDVDAANVTRIQKRRFAEAGPLELVEFRPDRSRKEVGSVEGRLIGVGSFRGKPAIRIRERKSGRAIWCEVSPADRGRVADAASFNEVWENRRVRIRGEIQFGSDGKISGAVAHRVQVVSPRKVSVEELRDPEFTEGMTAVEYLRHRREREIG